MGALCSKCRKGGEGGVGRGGGGSGAQSRGSAEAEGSNPRVKKIHNPSEFNDTLAESKKDGKLFVADFFAPWCGPCQLVGPKVDAFADDYADSVLFAKINVDENDELASSYGVSSMPTFILFKAGEKVDEISGANMDKLKQLIQKHCA